MCSFFRFFFFGSVLSRRDRETAFNRPLGQPPLINSLAFFIRLPPTWFFCFFFTFSVRWCFSSHPPYPTFLGETRARRYSYLYPPPSAFLLEIPSQKHALVGHSSLRLLCLPHCCESINEPSRAVPCFFSFCGLFETPPPPPCSVYHIFPKFSLPIPALVTFPTF